MKIDKRSEVSVYITIGDWVYYIDDSTGEQLMTKWNKTEKPNLLEKILNESIEVEK